MGDVYILVDLGGTRVRVALATPDRIVHRTEERTNLAEGPEGTEWQIDRLAREATVGAGARLADVKRMVIGAPGPLDHVTGTVRDAPNLPGWHEVHLADDLSRMLGVPVRAMNDANAAALGEYAYGAGRGLRHLAYLTISTGIGAGVVSDGVLLEGISGTAGEIGHTTIDRHGPRCPCGNIGCLEVLASGTSIARRFQEQLDAGRDSVLREVAGHRAITGADVAQAARDGDPLAAEVFRDAAEAVGTGVVNTVHIFNPEMVVIGGGVTHAGDLLFGPIEQMLGRYAMAVPRGAVRVVPAALGDDAGLYGALSRAASGEW